MLGWGAPCSLMDRDNIELKLITESKWLHPCFIVQSLQGRPNVRDMRSKHAVTGVQESYSVNVSHFDSGGNYIRLPKT